MSKEGKSLPNRQICPLLVIEQQWGAEFGGRVSGDALNKRELEWERCRGETGGGGEAERGRTEKSVRIVAVNLQVKLR